jgi:hypothetical protein
MNIAEENTARALKDQPLFATRQWWCKLGIHTWLMWATPEINKRGAYTFVEQYRSCGCCGKFERKVLSRD